MEFVSGVAEWYLGASAQLEAGLPALLPPTLAAAAADLDAQVKGVADGIGFPADQFKYVVCLFLAYPLAWIHRYAVRGRGAWGGGWEGEGRGEGGRERGAWAWA